MGSDTPFNLWQGWKVRLRSVRPEDADTYYTQSMDSEAVRLSSSLSTPDTYSKWLEHCSPAPKCVDGRSQMAIERISDGRLVGGINVLEPTDHCMDVVEYGVSVFRPYWRRGYAMEAIKLVLRYYFQERRRNYAYAMVFSFNEPSIALHNTLGFKEDGRLRGLYRSVGHHDAIFFGMLASEFEQQRLAASLPDVPWAASSPRGEETNGSETIS